MEAFLHTVQSRVEGIFVSQERSSLATLIVVSQSLVRAAAALNIDWPCDVNVGQLSSRKLTTAAF